jgi:hypothetical protein
MSDIKRFYVRDGFVLDEHQNGQVVRYSHHMARIEKLEEERDRLRADLRWALVNMEPRCADHEKWDRMLTALEGGGDG